MIVGTKSTSQFPYSLNAVELWAVWGQKVKTKIFAAFFDPRLYGFGMVPAGVVENNNHLMPLSPAAEKLLEEIKKCFCAKTVSLRNAQSSIGWADGTEDP